jgi:hypothetical protein
VADQLAKIFLISLSINNDYLLKNHSKYVNVIIYFMNKPVFLNTLYDRIEELCLRVFLLTKLNAL